MVDHMARSIIYQPTLDSLQQKSKHMHQDVIAAACCPPRKSNNFIVINILTSIKS